MHRKCWDSCGFDKKKLMISKLYLKIENYEFNCSVRFSVWVIKVVRCTGGLCSTGKVSVAIFLWFVLFDSIFFLSAIRCGTQWSSTVL